MPGVPFVGGPLPTAGVGGPTQSGAANLGDRVDRKAEEFEQLRVQEDMDGADAPVADVEHLDGEGRRRASRVPWPVDGNGQRAVGGDRREQLLT